jgi:hypothetical protein
MLFPLTKGRLYLKGLVHKLHTGLGASWRLQQMTMTTGELPGKRKKKSGKTLYSVIEDGLDLGERDCKLCGGLGVSQQKRLDINLRMGVENQLNGEFRYSRMVL